MATDWPTNLWANTSRVIEVRSAFHQGFLIILRLVTTVAWLDPTTILDAIERQFSS